MRAVAFPILSGAETQWIGSEMARCGAWRRRQSLLQPDAWRIHLVINDAGSARPWYHYDQTAGHFLRQYLPRIEVMLKEGLAQPGPDFFAVYSMGRSRWYGEDTVHPDLAGMDRMAALWSESISSTWK